MAKKNSSSKSKNTKTKKRDSDFGAKRGLWNGAISFGLVNIPVKVLSSREQPDIHFTMLDPSNLSKVGYKYYNKATGEDISRDATVKGFEYEKGNYVLFSDSDFKKANPKATQTIDIENFVELGEIDPVYFEKAYYLVPLKGGAKGYRLLSEALKKQNKIAVAKIVLHTKQHLAAIIPRGDFLLLELLHFAEEVKDITELETSQNDLPTVRAGEVDMAEKLIENMTADWSPHDYHDTYREDIMKLVHAKVKAGKATEIVEESVDSDLETSNNVTDLMPLLRKSLAAKTGRADKGGKKSG